VIVDNHKFTPIPYFLVLFLKTYTYKLSPAPSTKLRAGLSRRERE
jgi:hypothetical protein